ncbi:MAG: hypothetical protein ABI759_04180 [Candidatus Solibacter sp.]
MSLRCWFYIAILSVRGVYAGAIVSTDISSETTQVVRTGDRLLFHLFTWNFASNAERLNLPLYATDLSFALATPAGDAGAFEATVESEGGAVSFVLGELNFVPGTLSASGYTGDVSTLQGYLHFSPQLSAAIFKNGGMVIALRNLGPDVRLGLEPYLVRQNLFATLSGAGVSVGALPGWVELEAGAETRIYGMRLSSMEGEDFPVTLAEAPEPSPAVSLLSGGVFLLALSGLLKRLARSRR